VHAHLSPVEKQTLANQLTQEVLQRRESVADEAYQLGIRMARLYQNELYRSTGAKDWATFVEQTVHLSRPQVAKWMRVATHFSEESVKAIGVEVLDGYAQSLDRAHSPAPTDLSKVVVQTPGGEKHLGDLTGKEAAAAFHAPHVAVALTAEEQAQLTASIQAIAPIAHAHLAAVGGKAGAQAVLNVPLAQLAAVAAALAGTAVQPAIRKAPAKKPAAKKPAAKKAPARSAKKPAKKARK
jgi:hypothetical protein